MNGDETLGLAEGSARAVPARRPFLTMLEGWAVALAALTLLLVYSAVAAAVAGGRTSAQSPWFFVPHILLIALIVGGLRRLAVVLQTFILLIGGLLALALWLGAALHGQRGSTYGIIAGLQVPIFVLCFRSAKASFSHRELVALGPRIALGAAVGVIGWFAAGLAMGSAGAPARAREAQVVAGRRREWAKRDAETRVEVVAACLQQSPVTADSQPFFPATLGELPDATCPEAKQPAPEGFVVDYDPGPADSTGRHRAFHLAVHDSVASDSGRTYEVDESMIVRSWFGQGQRRYPAAVQQPLDFLGRVGRCIELARDSLGTPGLESYPASVADARRRQPCDARITADSSAFREAGQRGYYLVRYTAPARPRPHDFPGGFTLLLEPGRDSLGRGIGGGLLSFFSDTGGVVHMTRRPRAATASDPAIPDCLTLFGYGGHDPRVPCREYRPRQRWGLASQLPTIALSMSGNGTLGIGEELALLPHYQPILPRDAAVEVRVRWDSAGRDTVLTRRRGVPFGEQLGSGTFFRLRHAWADTGVKRLEVRVRTAAGEEYGAQQHINVVPKRP